MVFSKFQEVTTLPRSVTTFQSVRSDEMKVHFHFVLTTDCKKCHGA